MKKCKRKKGQLGLMLGLAAASVGSQIGQGVAGIFGASKQRKAEQYAANLDAANQSDASLQQAINSAIDNPKNNIQTLSNQMKCGGKKRVKKCGGGRCRKLYGGDFVKKCI